MEFVEILSPTALKELQTANAELVTMIANVDKVGLNMKNISTPSGSDSGIKSLTAQYEAQRATIQKLQSQLNSLAVTQRTVGTSASSQAKGTRENAVAQQILRAETDRQVRSTTNLGGAYAKASAQLLILKKSAKDYAIALGETHPKTLQAVQDAANLDGRIKAADKSVGDFQRNVGNYSGGIIGGFKGIYSQVRQLAYILPGIGIGGIFALALDPLFELIKGMDLFKAKINAVKETKKDLEDINKEAVTSSTQELISLQGNLKIAQDVNLSYKERMIAVKNLQDTYPFYFDNLTKEQILAGQTTQAEKALTEAILSRAKANAAVSKITENQSKIIDLEEIQLKLSKDLTDAKIRQSDATANANKSDLQRGESNAFKSVYAIGKVEEIQNKIAKNQKEINSLNDINNRLTAYSLANAEKAIGLDYKETKGKKELKRAKIEEIKLEKEAVDGLIPRLEEQIKLIKEVQQSASTHAEWQLWQDGIDQLNGYIDIIKNGFVKELAESAKKATDEFEKIYGSRAKKQVEEMAKATRDFIDSFNNGFLASNGLGGLDMFFRKAENGRTVFQNLYDDAQKVGEGWKVTFLGITQVAEEAFGFIDKFGKQNFDAQYSRLEQEKNIAIQFAGESTTARAEVERQYEQKKKKIAREQAESEKKTAIFKAIINTAQAVVSALPNIPLSIAVGVIGAAQIALIASQQIPAFAKGTDNAPEGWALTQEQGREIITDKSGKVKSLGSEKGAQYTYLNKGDRVFKNANTEAMMFNSNLNNMLLGNGVVVPKIEISMDAEKITNEIKALANTIANKESFSIVRDERGERKYLRKQAETKELLNNVLTYRGYDV